MTFELILTGPGPDGQKITIGRKITHELQTYKKNAIRFIYDCYVTNQHGAILNIDLDMNHEHACAVALNALHQRGMQNLPSIVLCSEARCAHWFYFMKKYSDLDAYMVTASNIERLLARKEAIVLIATEKEHAVLRQYVKDVQFFCFIVDQVDLLSEKLITKQIQAEFHLGVTHRNFIIEPNQQLRWKITNWALMKLNKQFAKLNDFMEYDTAYVQIRVDPYSAFWHAITWELCSITDQARCEESKRSLLESIERCAQSHGLQLNANANSKPKRKPAANKNATQTANKRKRTRRPQEPELCFDHWTSDEDLPPDLSAFKISPSLEQSPRLSPKKLRLKSPVNKTRPVDDFNCRFVDVKRCATPLRKAKSARALLFDQEVIEEFSKPFEPKSSANCALPLQATKSDSALIMPAAQNVRTPHAHDEEALSALQDVNVLREFSTNFEASTSWQSLMTSEIRISQSSNASACNTCSSKPLSQEDVADELNLRLSDDSIDAQLRNVLNPNEEIAAFQETKESTPSAPAKCTSSDDELDNYMSQLLATMKQANKLNPKQTSHYKFVDATSNSRITSEREEIDSFTKFLSGDSDSDNCLKDFIRGKCMQGEGTSSTRVHLHMDNQDDESDDNYLLSFL